MTSWSGGTDRSIQPDEHRSRRTGCEVSANGEPRLSIREPCADRGRKFSKVRLDIEQLIHHTGANDRLGPPRILRCQHLRHFGALRWTRAENLSHDFMRSSFMAIGADAPRVATNGRHEQMPLHAPLRILANLISQ
jgi:hypothetical protein